MAITATLVRELRDKTGAAMMDCKKALEATGGDLEKAVDHLRKSGLKTAEKKSQRETGEGRVFSKIDAGGTKGSLVSVQCETDFVAKTPDFEALLGKLCDHMLEHGPKDADELYGQKWSGSDETVEGAVKQTIGKLGENIKVAQVCRQEVAGGQVGSYIHHNQKVGVLVSVQGDVSEETLKDLCLHVAFHNPPYLTREEVPAEDLEREKAILRESDELKKKPAEFHDKIIEGKLKSFYKDKCLLEQPWIKDDKQSVKQALGKAQVLAFARFEIAS